MPVFHIYAKERPEGLENMGKPWREPEVTTLLKEIKDGITIQEIAKSHKRTNGGIISRLCTIAYSKYKGQMSITDIMELTRLSKDQVIEAINKHEYADDKKAEKSKKPSPVVIAKEVEVLSKTLEPKTEKSELQEILKTLKSLEARVTEYIRERSIFDE
jgi:hypothetical protein